MQRVMRMYKQQNRFGIRKLSQFVIACLTVVFVMGLYVADLHWAKPTASFFSQPLQGKTFVLDAGHGGVDGGAQSSTGLKEKSITLPVTLYLRDLLVQAGAHVILTRDSDKDLAPADLEGLSKRKTADLKARLQIIRDAKPNLFVTIHTNADPSPQWYGAQTFYREGDEEGKTIANQVQKSFQSHLIPTNRQIKQIDGIYLMTHAGCPAILTEVGFISNPMEAAKLQTKEYQQKIAACIYISIFQHFASLAANL
jgi:N-acetylmuramoyl-L-alanine amidase